MGDSIQKKEDDSQNVCLLLSTCVSVTVCMCVCVRWIVSTLPCLSVYLSPSRTGLSVLLLSESCS